MGRHTRAHMQSAATQGGSVTNESDTRPDLRVPVLDQIREGRAALEEEERQGDVEAQEQAETRPSADDQSW